MNIIREGFHPLKGITALLPWDHLAVDLKEMPLAATGEQHLLVLADVATDYTVLVPLKTKDKFSVARALWSVFASFGMPLIIQSDNGKEFVNEVLAAMSKLHGIDHRFISAYHPRANGFVERKNLDLHKMFKKLLGGQIQDWVCYVPFVQLSYNARISSRTGSTAFSLMFGRALRAFGTSLSLEKDFDIDRWQEHQEKMQSIVHPAILERVKEKKTKQAVRFNETHKIVDAILPGSVVYLKDTAEKSKWINENNGPFKVVRQTRGGAYILENRAGTTLTQRFPPQLLKVVPHAEFEKADQSKSYYVQKILDAEQLANGSYRYLVKFKELKEPLWLEPSDFDGSMMIAAYWRKQLKQ